jgi:hypothetical protein
MRLHLALVTLASVTAASLAYAQQAMPADTQKNQAAVPAAPCSQRFAIPDNAVILAAGTYSGRTLGFQIDQSGHAATQVDVNVNYPTRPVVLMLSAYEPTIWNIKRSSSTEIVAVYASGYHRQAIAGIDPNVQQSISTYDNRGKCGYLYATAEKLDELNPHARKVFGRAVSAFYPVDNGLVAIGDPVSAGVPMLGSEITPETYRDPVAPLAGQAGLQAAVQAGVLRKATRADSDAWLAARRALPPTPDLPPVIGNNKPARQKIDFFNAYVVLKPFVYPAGLYGAHAATFLVPKGTPRPTGNPGHSTVYSFDTMTCSGALCAMQ